jgi:glycosyltransferase involved in cell wall biosynthesis
LIVRILHIVHQYFPDHVGGTEHYVRTLAQSQMQTGHQAAIFCRQSGDGRDIDKSFDQVGVGSARIPVCRAIDGPFTATGRFWSTLGNHFLAGAMSHVISDVQPDLIHVHHLQGLPVTALLDIEPAVPIVVTLHDYWWLCANAQLITDYDSQVCDGPRWWLNCARCGLSRASAANSMPLGGIPGQVLSPMVAPFFARRAALLRRLIPRVDAWMALTTFVADWHLAQGFPARQMHMIDQGIKLPSEDVIQASGRLPDQHGGPTTRFAYIGGLAQQKGVHVLIDAFNELPPSARLTIAGDETAFPDYCAFLRARAAHPGIHFAGRLARSEVWQTMCWADVLVVPSLWYETSSLVVLEAFAARTPVVAADHGALAERVQHEINGLLTPPGDVLGLRQALQRLMEEPSLLARLQGGIKPVLDLEEHVRRVERVYRHVWARN